ncbi:hypothetical protein [Gulosibacter sediminis]|uniref:hypothetical protein n=1 Tax=Gulosibacter sediminis TaxID=1729695 RepID=UPI0024A7BBAB|nr:hypothetical protein [Gulosibacter sediminis]
MTATRDGGEGSKISASVIGGAPSSPRFTRILRSPYARLRHELRTFESAHASRSSKTQVMHGHVVTDARSTHDLEDGAERHRRRTKPARLAHDFVVDGPDPARD